VANEPILIIQVPRGGAIERQLQEQPPPSLTTADVLIQIGPTDDEGNLEALSGEVVFSVPGPEELERQAEAVQRAVRQAGTGTAPLVVEVGAAEELLDEQAAPVAEAARHAGRTVILRVIRPSET
jgi:hypothetical protein